MIKKNELVYICSPLSAPTKMQMRENMNRARFYVNVISSQFGCREIAPHVFLPEYLDDNIPEERAIGLQFGLAVLERSKAVIVCGNRISTGMSGEIKRAKELQIPVYALLIQENEISLTGFEEKEGSYGMPVCKDNFSE